MCLLTHQLYLLKSKQGIWPCVVSNFHLRLEKMMIIWKIWNFLPGLKFDLGLAKPSWNFNSLYRAEIFTCNCNVILKRSYLTEMKFQLGILSWNFNPSWKSPYNQPVSVNFLKYSINFFNANLISFMLIESSHNLIVAKMISPTIRVKSLTYSHYQLDIIKL